jgi:hypothetical protein
MPYSVFQSNVPLLPGNQIYLERSRIDVPEEIEAGKVRIAAK